MKEILQVLKSDFIYHPQHPKADIAAAIKYKLENPKFVYKHAISIKYFS